MSRLILDARETVSSFYGPIEPVLGWEELLKAADARLALEENRKERNRKDKDHAP